MTFTTAALAYDTAGRLNAGYRARGSASRARVLITAEGYSVIIIRA